MRDWTKENNVLVDNFFSTKTLFQLSLSKTFYWKIVVVLDMLVQFVAAVPAENAVVPLL